MAMKSRSVPYQRFCELVDAKTAQSVLDFHVRGNYALSPKLRSRGFLTTLSDSELHDLTHAEISLFPGSAPEIEEGIVKDDGRFRKPSTIGFKPNNPLGFLSVISFISKCLFALCDDDGSARMPYPSGGALYSVKVFACRTASAVKGWPDASNVLHVRPMSNGVDCVPYEGTPARLLDMLSGGEAQRLGEPSFAFVYVVFLDQAIFKYRHRGYRLALMEAGAIFQNCTRAADEAGLGTRVWAGFSDNLLCAELNLDPNHMLPIAVQFFGARNDA